ncbi:uncharacterized protein LOC129216831 [Uloborus diversus]|uniref:uncharacterized protein LOC129216831 n=1 Tax=Uloborus diversus TaxID=327109 RepID=UPI0024090D91|nr:uncharacterized protein LOC129216831 [Uloborus diversus]
MDARDIGSSSHGWWVPPNSGAEGAQPDNAKTRQATRYGVRLFREYCEQHGVEAINALGPRDIAKMLKGFYGQARTKDGQRFSVNSLIAIRYAISRYYRSPMVHRKVDIVKDVAFNDANETFRAVLKDLEREARGSPACHRELQMVDMDDRRKLRHYFEHAIGTPRGLLQKVWYDLMLRVGRRGRESQRLLNRNSFRIAKTPDGRQYIYQVDDEEAGIIVEIPGDPLCPVKTLKMYLGRLNPACRALFQRPKEHVYEQDTCWYVNSPVGKNMLATMMSTISKCARLSRIYTNVRIRATTYSPADGKGCIPCTDTVPPAEQMETTESKPREPVQNQSEKKPEKPAPPQNSHIIKQLNAPIVQACLSVAVPNSTNPSNSVIGRVFPVSLSGMQKTELLNGQTLTIKPQEKQESQSRQCDWCKKELSTGSMVLKSSEAGKEYCSTECLGKWLASEHKQSENGPVDGTTPDSPSNPKIQKLLTLCSSANLLIPFPSICKDLTPAVPEEEAMENGCIAKAESRSSSPQLIVPDEVYSEAVLDSDTESSVSPRAEEYTEKSTCDQEVMCAPTMTSLAISCKPILKNQAVQTDFSTYFEENLFGWGKAPSFPRYVVNSFCCSKDEAADDSDVVEEAVLHGDVCFDDTQDTHSLWMSVEECDEEGEAVEFLPPVEIAKCEDALIAEPLAAVYSHRGRTTKRTTWDEIAQRSKLQTLWGVKVFREWLQARGSRKDFERLEGATLADILEEFYENLTKPDGEEYSVSTMHTIRASISRYLSLPPQSKPFSIIRDREFKRANEAFYRRIRRLQTPRQQPFQYQATAALPPGNPALWRPPPGTVGIPCQSNGIMLVRLGPQ